MNTKQIIKIVLAGGILSGIATTLKATNKEVNALFE